jgi:hypothetical protein
MENVKQVQLSVVLDRKIRKRKKKFYFLINLFVFSFRGANHTDPQHYQCCSGFYIDIFHVLKDRLKFEFELYQVLDRTWGVRDPMTVKI